MYIEKLSNKHQLVLSSLSIYNYANRFAAYPSRCPQWTAIQIFVAIDTVLADLAEFKAALDAGKKVCRPYIDHVSTRVFKAPKNVVALWDLVGSDKLPSPVAILVNTSHLPAELYLVKKMLRQAATFRNWTRKINKALATIATEKPVIEQPVISWGSTLPIVVTPVQDDLYTKHTKKLAKRDAARVTPKA